MKIEIYKEDGVFWWNGPEYIKTLEPNQILVVGTNPEGRHSLGLALIGKTLGLVYGKGRGLQGRAYGLITKNLTAGYREELPTGAIVEYPKAGRRSLSDKQLKYNAMELIECACKHKDKDFIMPYKALAENLNGISSYELFMTFRNLPMPDNIVWHESLKQYHGYQEPL